MFARSTAHLMSREPPKRIQEFYSMSGDRWPFLGLLLEVYGVFWSIFLRCIFQVYGTQNNCINLTVPTQKSVCKIQWFCLASRIHLGPTLWPGCILFKTNFCVRTMKSSRKPEECDKSFFTKIRCRPQKAITKIAGTPSFLAKKLPRWW